MKHNIERENYETATKEEKARHNGVDTSRWGNDNPRIAVPEGMEDHQHTQQLVRLYLNNDNSFYIFSGNKVLVFLTEKELQTSKVDEVIDGWYVSTYLRVGMTFKGLCLNWHVRKIGIYDDIPFLAKARYEQRELPARGQATPFAPPKEDLACHPGPVG